MGWWEDIGGWSSENPVVVTGAAAVAVGITYGIMRFFKLAGSN